jgi:hypothetical protein
MTETDAALDRLAMGFRRLKGIDTTEADTSDEILFDEWDWEVGVGLYGLDARGPYGEALEAGVQVRHESMLLTHDEIVHCSHAAVLDHRRLKNEVIHDSAILQLQELLGVAA